MVVLSQGHSHSVTLLPPVDTKSAGRKAGSAGSKLSTSARLAPRISELKRQLGQSEPAVKSACGELAMIASRSINACVAVAEAEIEPPLSKVLGTTHDTSIQCWALSILSNTAAVPKSRDRQASCAVPALCQLLCSPVAEVQHAAALHLATLSHSEGITQAISSSRDAMATIRELEKGSSNALASPAYGHLRQEASQYARWALRTAQGRNYKPAYKPKSAAQLEKEGAIEIQKRVRSALVAASYRRELRERKAAAVLLQAGYRAHTDRAELARKMLIEAPAAAAMQALVRGKQHRNAAKAAEAAEAAARESAAATVQARVRGNASRSGPGGCRKVNKCVGLPIPCADGVVVLSVAVDGLYEFVGGSARVAGGEGEGAAAEGAAEGAADEGAEGAEGEDGGPAVRLVISVLESGEATVACVTPRPSE